MLRVRVRISQGWVSGLGNPFSQNSIFSPMAIIKPSLILLVILSVSNYAFPNFAPKSKNGLKHTRKINCEKYVNETKHGKWVSALKKENKKKRRGSY